MVVSQRSVDRYAPLHEQEPITVAIPNFNGRNDIGDAIRSVKQSAYPVHEIIVVDDGSTDGSVTYIRETFPDVRVVEMGRNTKMLNRVRNRALCAARTRLVFLMDHDVVLSRSCLSELVCQMRRQPAAVLTTRALSLHDPGRIYVDVQRMHFLCNSVAFHRDGLVSDAGDVPQLSFGWGTQLIDTEKAAAIGYFDEEYVMGWGDDGEFHHRLHLAGLGCYSVPAAVVYHKRHEGAGRVYGGIRNRWYLLIETYALRTMLLLAPALLLYELAMFAFVCVNGEWRDYLRALRDTILACPRLLAKRRRIQQQRVCFDRDLLVAGPIYIREGMIGNSVLRAGLDIMNRAFNGYWALVQRAL